MWGWITTIAGAVGGVAAVVMVAPAAVGYGVVAACAVGGVVVAHGLRSIWRDLKGTEQKNEVAKMDHALNKQDEDKAKNDLEMQAVKDKAKSDQEGIVAKLSAKLEETAAKYQTKKDQLKELQDLYEAQSLKLFEFQDKYKAISGQLEQSQTDLANKADELSKKSEECEQIYTKLEELLQSHAKTKLLLDTLIAQVKEDESNIKKLQAEKALLIKLQQGQVKSQSGALNKSLSSDTEKSALPTKSAKSLHFMVKPKQNDSADFAEDDSNESPQQTTPSFGH